MVDELPWHYQAMLFWAGLRGAVGVALAAGLRGENGNALRATVLVVVVLTVIIFGGTTARMLEILGIRTGVVEEIDSDDEFDIETDNGGTYYKRTGGTGFGHNPRPSNISLGHMHKPPGVNGSASPGRPSRLDRGYSSSNRHSPPIRPGSRADRQRKNSTISSVREREEEHQHNHLLDRSNSPTDDGEDDDGIDLDLPPAAPRRKSPSPLPPSSRSAPDLTLGDSEHEAGDLGASTSPVAVGGDRGMMGGVRDLLRGATADHTAWFRQLDEDFIKPKLLLDQGGSGGGGGNGSGKGPPGV